LDLVYITDNVIAMGFPVQKQRNILRGASGAMGANNVMTSAAAQKKGNDIDTVAAFFRSRHSGHYMVWNISEEGYDYVLFEDQV
ncbi:unnamed protein product, partial [Choristocarpus tenellus]